MLASAAAAARSAAILPLFLPQQPPDKVSGLIHAATLLAQLLGQDRLLDSRALRSAMESAFAASDAGGAGRSYHADLGCRNQRRRVHDLLEPGWKADTAIQGLGRSNRTNRKPPPLFRPVATDVKGEKRFLSNIARGLDTLLEQDGIAYALHPAPGLRFARDSDLRRFRLRSSRSRSSFHARERPSAMPPPVIARQGKIQRSW